ncbi:glycosyl hydrolase family 3 [Colletotrichum limetticola]|uniref:Glycosyl hydrolase family 3 n=1 Tax=Colletotrichum limetticola TaxID=1209924 RepID=A0ABQ9Q6Q1_9PEZI|nr:glycosyl hydrolase family 3 [Colletotrichum limetticola]
MGAFVSKQPYSYQSCGAVTDAANILDLQYDDPTNNGPKKCQDTCIANSRAASLLLDGKCYCSKDGITSIQFAADPPPDEQLCTISCSEVLPPIIPGISPPINLPCGGYDNGVPPFNLPHINLFKFLLHFIIIPGFSFLDIICDLLVFILRYNFIGFTFNPLFYNIVTLRFFFLLYVIVILRLSFLDIVFKFLNTIILYNLQ